VAESIPKSAGELALEVETLRAQLAEAQDVIRAIQSGDVDALVVSGPQGEQVFTLKGAEYAYRALVEAMNEGAATLSHDGVVLYCNQRLAGLLDISEERIIGAPVAKLISPGSSEEFAALMANALAGESGKAELRLKGAGRNSISAYVSLRRIESDEPSAVCMVVTDLTEHKKRDELIAAGELSRSILESAAEAIAVCDTDGTIIRANTALKNLCGSNPLFQPFDAVFPLEIVREASGAVEPFSVFTVLQGESLRAQEVSFCRADGKVLSLLLSSGHVAAPSGLVGCVLTMADITDRKLAQAALRRSEKLVAVGRLAATIAHEVNNPLAAAMNAVYLANSDLSLSAPTRDALSIADQELRRAAHITSRTLGFYRMNGPREPVELPKLIDEVVELYAKRLQDRGIDVHRRYRCHACPQACFVADAGELRQVISNLLINGMDAVRENGTLHMRVGRLSKFGNKGDVVRLTVADSGGGIRTEHLKRLFEPFFTTKESVGTGLGLWISQEIIRNYGGSIRIRSQENKGTVCCVTLPAMPGNTSIGTPDRTGHCAALDRAESNHPTR
jgi:PAS domain S-box-containing protein